MKPLDYSKAIFPKVGPALCHGSMDNRVIELVKRIAYTNTDNPEGDRFIVWSNGNGDEPILIESITHNKGSLRVLYKRNMPHSARFIIARMWGDLGETDSVHAFPLSNGRFMEYHMWGSLDERPGEYVKDLKSWYYWFGPDMLPAEALELSDTCDRLKSGGAA